MMVIKLSFKIIYTFIFLWIVCTTEFDFIKILNTVNSIRVKISTNKKNLNFNNNLSAINQYKSKYDNNEISIFSSLGNLLQNIGQEVTYKKSCPNYCDDSLTNTTQYNNSLTIGQGKDRNNRTDSNFSSPIVNPGIPVGMPHNKDIKPLENPKITNPTTPPKSCANPSRGKKTPKKKVIRQTIPKAKPKNQNNKFNQANLDFDSAIAPDDTTEASIKMLINEQIKTSKIIQEAIKKLENCTPNIKNNCKDSSDGITPNNQNVNYSANLEENRVVNGSQEIGISVSNRPMPINSDGTSQQNITNSNNQHSESITHPNQDNIQNNLNKNIPINSYGTSQQNITNSNNQHSEGLTHPNQDNIQNNLNKNMPINSYGTSQQNITNSNNQHSESLNPINPNNIQNNLNKNMPINSYGTSQQNIPNSNNQHSESLNPINPNNIQNKLKEDYKGNNISNDEMICFTKHQEKQYSYWQTEISKSEYKELFFCSDNFCYVCCEHELKGFALHCCLEKCDYITQGINISLGCSPFFN